MEGDTVSQEHDRDLRREDEYDGHQGVFRVGFGLCAQEVHSTHHIYNYLSLVLSRCALTMRKHSANLRYVLLKLDDSSLPGRKTHRSSSIGTLKFPNQSLKGLKSL